MAQVLITDTKLNSLANAIAEKAGIEAPLTIQQMEDAIEALSWAIYYTGSSEPNNSQGNNGDIYLQTESE